MLLCYYVGMEVRKEKNCSLAEYLKVSREQLGLKQKDVASSVEISIPYMFDLEHGNRFPSDKVLDNLISVLKLDKDWAYYLAGKYPSDLRNNIEIDAIKKAFRVMRKA